MATKVVTELRDDLDGTQADETVRFALDGIEYEIDLSGRNANRLRNSLSDFIEHGRRVGGSRRGRRAGRSSDGVDNVAVRKWAEAHNIQVSSRGRISAEVLEQYRRAGN
jgi:Lsr2